MDRFLYLPAKLDEDESIVYRHRNIRLYDGNAKVVVFFYFVFITFNSIFSKNKTSFEDGEILLTTHRLFWGNPGEIDKGMTILCLQLKYVASLGEELASYNVFGKKKRMILHLNDPPSNGKYNLK